MISPRKGKIIISKELYDSTEINDALFKLEMKVYKVDYIPFQDWYEIYFTSKYLPAYLATYIFSHSNILASFVLVLPHLSQ